MTARFDGRTDQAAIIVLPSGTFRLAGIVTENHVGLEKAAVTVISGIGEGLTAATDVRGQYALYGVVGQVEVRASRDGYFERIQQFNVTSHGWHHFEMVASTNGPSIDLSGTYTLTVSAEGSSRCVPDFPELLKRRIYTATVDQTGPYLSVSLSGADFVIARDGSGNSFRGVETTGELTFSLRPSTVWDYDGPDVVERLSDGTALCVAGSIIARSTPTGIIGTVDQSRGATIYQCSGSYISHAGCSIERFEMVRR